MAVLNKNNVEEIDIPGAMKRLRKKNGWSQGEIFRRTKLERSSVSRLESGCGGMPTLQVIARISKAFDMKISDFIRVAEECAKKNKRIKRIR